MTALGITFKPVELATLADDIRAHYQACGVIDSYFEDRIREAVHYRIEVDGEAAGFASVTGHNRLTQFSLRGARRRRGQEAYQAARRLENVDSAFVPTSDEFYLSHALDSFRELELQAYFFEWGGPAPVAPPDGFELRQAGRRDVALITKLSGGYFTDLASQIRDGQIFLSLREGVPVGVGVRKAGEFSAGVASIGMFTFEPFRQTGVGVGTITSLIALCLSQEIRPVAGCWYHNHASKKTLERAGMVTPTRLLKVLY